MQGPRRYNNFIYNKERGFVFAFVPKVACTNWKSLLRYMEGHQNWLDSKLAHDVANSGLHYIGNSEAGDAILRDNSIKKYAMVRDPYTRVLSAYLNKIDSRLRAEFPSGDKFSKVVKIIDAFRNKKLDVKRFPSVSFEVFLIWLSQARKEVTADGHWEPQHKLLRIPDIHYDFIGKFENIKHDSDHILNLMGCDAKFPTQGQIKFKPTNATNKLAEHYTPGAYELVRKLYAKDFEAFDYDISAC